jgi:hypothetical protein
LGLEVRSWEAAELGVWRLELLVVELALASEVLLLEALASVKLIVVELVLAPEVVVLEARVESLVRLAPHLLLICATLEPWELVLVVLILVIIHVDFLSFT